MLTLEGNGGCSIGHSEDTWRYTGKKGEKNSEDGRFVGCSEIREEY